MRQMYVEEERNLAFHLLYSYTAYGINSVSEQQ